MKPPPAERFEHHYSAFLSEILDGIPGPHTVGVLDASILLKTYGQIDVVLRGFCSVASLDATRKLLDKMAGETYTNEMDIDDQEHHLNLWQAALVLSRLDNPELEKGLFWFLIALDEYMRGRCSIGTAIMLNDMAITYGTTTSEGFKQAYDMHRADLRLRVINHHSPKGAVELPDGAMEELDLSRFITFLEQKEM